VIRQVVAFEYAQRSIRRSAASRCLLADDSIAVGEGDSVSVDIVTGGSGGRVLHTAGSH
jgi:hypothetical protein